MGGPVFSEIRPQFLFPGTDQAVSERARNKGQSQPPTPDKEEAWDMQYQAKPEPQLKDKVQACPKMENCDPDQPLTSPGQLEPNNMIAACLVSHI